MNSGIQMCIRDSVEVVRAIPKDAYGVDVDRVGAVSDDAVIDLFRIADVVPSSAVGLVRIPVGDEVPVSYTHLKTVLGTAGIFPASRSCISPHPENKAKVTPKRRRKKSHSNGTAGRQGIKVF